MTMMTSQLGRTSSFVLVSSLALSKQEEEDEPRDPKRWYDACSLSEGGDCDPTTIRQKQSLQIQ